MGRANILYIDIHNTKRRENEHLKKGRKMKFLPVLLVANEMSHGLLLIMESLFMWSGTLEYWDSESYGQFT